MCVCVNILCQYFACVSVHSLTGSFIIVILVLCVASLFVFFLVDFVFLQKSKL